MACQSQWSNVVSRCICLMFSQGDELVSHPAQPKVHSLDSPVSIFIEEKIVSTDESTESFFVGRNIRIIHQILHHLLCHVHSFHLSSPTSDQQGVCHDIGRTRLFLFICLNKSIARSMFFNSIQPCMSVL